jgi:hypothetical protein
MVGADKPFPVKVYFPAAGFLQGVDAADEGALAGTGRPDDRKLFPFPDMQINILEGLQSPEKLVNPLHPDHPSLLKAPGRARSFPF